MQAANGSLPIKKPGIGVGAWPSGSTTTTSTTGSTPSTQATAADTTDSTEVPAGDAPTTTMVEVPEEHTEEKSKKKGSVVGTFFGVIFGLALIAGLGTLGWKYAPGSCMLTCLGHKLTVESTVSC